jgi:hypothetical protein
MRCFLWEAGSRESGWAAPDATEGLDGCAASSSWLAALLAHGTLLCTRQCVSVHARSQGLPQPLQIQLTECQLLSRLTRLGCQRCSERELLILAE